MKHSSLKDFATSFAFLLPLLGFAILFLLFPVLSTFFTSLFQDVEFMEHKFIAFENYARLFGDENFWNSLRFTLLFIVVSVPLQLVIGLSFALILNEPLPFRWLLRVSVLIPWAIPAAISAKTWELIYNYQYGLANFFFTKLGMATGPINWLGTDLSAFWSLVTADTWKTVPFVTIILLAGLQTIPTELYAQAKVDRANFMQRFLNITLPLLRPVIVVVLLFRTIDALRIFDLIYVLTEGGPGGSTTSLSLYSYQYFLLSDFGYGSTVSVILFLIAFILSIFYIKVGKFREATTA